MKQTENTDYIVHYIDAVARFERKPAAIIVGNIVMKFRREVLMQVHPAYHKYLRFMLRLSHEDMWEFMSTIDGMRTYDFHDNSEFCGFSIQEIDGTSWVGASMPSPPGPVIFPFKSRPFRLCHSD